MMTVVIPFRAILVPKKLYIDLLPEFQLPPWIKIKTFFFSLFLFGEKMFSFWLAMCFAESAGKYSIPLDRVIDLKAQPEKSVLNIIHKIVEVKIK